MTDPNKSLIEWYTRMHGDADIGKPMRGTATRETREILCQILDPRVWWAIESAAMRPLASIDAESYRERAGYMLDSPDILL